MAKFQEARIGLNIRKPWNNGFFCSLTRLHLTKESPVGIIRKVTPAILRGLKGGHIEPTLIDIDGRIDFVTGDFKEIPEEQVVKQDVEEDKEFVIDGPVVEIIPPVEEDKPAAKKKSTKKK